MTSYAISPAPVSSLPIQGEQARFPVNRIFCVGRNYSEHAREMGHNPDREPPFFFMKPASAIVADVLQKMIDAQPDNLKKLVEGFTAGYNRYVRDVKAGGTQPLGTNGTSNTLSTTAAPSSRSNRGQYCSLKHQVKRQKASW